MKAGKRSSPLRRLLWTMVILVGLLLALAAGSLSVALAGDREIPVFGPLSERLTNFAIDILDEPANKDDARVIKFTVNQGETADAIGRRLNEQGLISNELLFRFAVRYYKVGAGFQAGSYELRRDMTVRTVIDQLQRERKANMFTVLEGWRSEEIAAAGAKAGFFDAAAFLRLVRQSAPDYVFLAARPAGSSLEGYLFPDSYDLSPNTDPARVLKLLLDNFDAKFTPEMRQQAAAKGLSIYQVITLASIVEREAVVAAERPVIAGVFFSRLKADMPLAADPTVQYAIASKPENAARDGYWKKEITQADLAVDSPYNTRKFKGLPPGPIGNPGLDSIMAVLQPADTGYLYFVARPDGSHVFARTFEEHLANVEKYQP